MMDVELIFFYMVLMGLLCVLFVLWMIDFGCMINYGIGGLGFVVVI